MTSEITSSENVIEILSVLQKKIRTTRIYWEHIVQHKHGELEGRLQEILEVMRDADDVYRQDEISDIYLYYKNSQEYSACAVAKHLNGDGFIVTAYITTKTKRKGICVWIKKTK